MNLCNRTTRLLFVVFTLNIFAVGCASPASPSYLERAQESISKGNFEIAYRLMEDVFLSGNTETRKRAMALYESDKNLSIAARLTFSEDKLLKSISSYGLTSSYDLELRRLGLYKEVAASSEYVEARTIFEEIYAPRLQALKSEEEDKAVRLKAEQEAKAVKDKELALEAKRAKERHAVWLRNLSLYLSESKSNAVIRCKDRVECDKAFSLTQIYINSESTTKIQLATDSIIETYNTSSDGGVSMKAVKIPGQGSSSTIILDVRCLGSYELCSLTEIEKYQGFTEFLKKMLK